MAKERDNGRNMETDSAEVDIGKESVESLLKKVGSSYKNNYVKWKFLLGFFNEAEALARVKTQGIPLDSNEEERIKNEIQHAVQYVEQIKDRKNVIPEIKPIPSDHRERLEKIQQEPTFAEHLVGIKTWSFGLVELNKLHCFQTSLNLEYVESLVKKAPEPDDIEGSIKFCLPLRGEEGKIEVLSGFNPNTNTCTIVTDNLDLRVLGNVQGEENTTKRNFVGFVYGFGLRGVSVANYNGLFMVKNGYHRAFALLQKGHKYMPCLVVETDAYQLTGAGSPNVFTPELMNSDKSPLLSDFNSKASVTILRRRMKAVAIIHGEILVVPPYKQV